MKKFMEKVNEKMNELKVRQIEMVVTELLRARRIGSRDSEVYFTKRIIEITEEAYGRKSKDIFIDETNVNVVFNYSYVVFSLKDGKFSIDIKELSK